MLAKTSHRIHSSQISLLRSLQQGQLLLLISMDQCHLMTGSRLELLHSIHVSFLTAGVYLKVTIHTRKGSGKYDGWKYSHLSTRWSLRDPVPGAHIRWKVILGYVDILLKIDVIGAQSHEGRQILLWIKVPHQVLVSILTKTGRHTKQVHYIRPHLSTILGHDISLYVVVQ